MAWEEDEDVEAFTFENEIIDILYDETPPEWLIPGIIVRGTVSCLAGEPGTGKSVLSYTTALAIAAGVGCLSGQISADTPKRVLYFDQENSRPDRNQYLKWAWRGLGRPDVATLNENFLPVSKKLGRPDWQDVAAKYVRIFKPDLIYFDTAISCFAAESENNNAEAATIINKLQQLIAIPEKDASAIVLRHGKDNSERRADGKQAIKKMRGATVWKSQVDQTLHLMSNRGAPRKDGTTTTRLEPDKFRAFGFSRRVFINPVWVDGETFLPVKYRAEEKYSYGMRLDGSLVPDKESKRRLAEEGEDEE